MIAIFFRASSWSGKKGDLYQACFSCAHLEDCYTVLLAPAAVVSLEQQRVIQEDFAVLISHHVYNSCAINY